MVICRQHPGTASGVTFMTLEDETGFVNLVLWRKIFVEYSVLAKTQAFLGVTGKLQVDSSKPKVDSSKQIDDSGPQVDGSRPQVDGSKLQIDGSKPQVDSGKPQAEVKVVHIIAEALWIPEVRHWPESGGSRDFH
jgi:DNA polymerase III alpha subunit